MSPSGTAAKKRPNISEDTLREVKRLLTGDRPEFKPATLGESLKYNFLGLTPEKERQSGSFGKALMDETKSQFRQLFGIKTTKAERKAEEEAALKKIEEEKKAKELQEQQAEKNSDNIEAILGEVRTIRKVTEGSVKYSPKSGRYHDASTGRFVGASSVSGIDAPSVSGIDAPTDNTQEKILEKLEEIDENTEVAGGADGGGFLDMLSGISVSSLSSLLLPILVGVASIWSVDKIRDLVDKVKEAGEARDTANTALNKEQATNTLVLENLNKKGGVYSNVAQQAAAAMAENPELPLVTAVRNASRDLNVEMPRDALKIDETLRDQMAQALNDARLGPGGKKGWFETYFPEAQRPEFMRAPRRTMPANLLAPTAQPTQPVVFNNMNQIAPTTQMTAPAGIPTAKELRDELGSYIRFQQERIVSPLK